MQTQYKVIVFGAVFGEDAIVFQEVLKPLSLTYFTEVHIHYFPGPNLDQPWYGGRGPTHGTGDVGAGGEEGTPMVWECESDWTFKGCVLVPQRRYDMRHEMLTQRAPFVLA